MVTRFNKEQMDSDTAYKNSDNNFSTLQTMPYATFSSLAASRLVSLDSSKSTISAVLSQWLTSADNSVTITDNLDGTADLSVNTAYEESKWNEALGVLTPKTTNASVTLNSFINIERDGIADNCFSHYKNTYTSISQEWAVGLNAGGGGLFVIKNVTDNNTPIVVYPEVQDYAIHIQYINGTSTFGFNVVSFSPSDYFVFGNNVFTIDKSGRVGIGIATPNIRSTDRLSLSSGHRFLSTGDTTFNANTWTGWNAYYSTEFKVLTSGINAFLMDHNEANNSFDLWFSTGIADFGDPLTMFFSVKNQQSGIYYGMQMEGFASAGSACNEKWKVGGDTAMRQFSGGYYEICRDGTQHTETSAFSIDIINNSVRQIKDIQTQTLRALTITAGSWNNIDITEYGSLFIDDSGGNVTIRGFVGGIGNQILFIDKRSISNSLTLIRNDPTATQKIFTSSAGDAVYTGLGPIILYNNPIDNTWHVRDN